MRIVARWLFAVVWPGLVAAQETVAPTPEAAGPPRGQEIGNYNVVQWFETGYRWRSVGGDLGKYRSDVNFGNGVRLLGSRLSVNSRDGRGRFFDEILLATQGLGNDPYQFSSLRVQKNRVYRYDFTWRLDDYYNPALTVAAGQHFLNTERRLQDHEFTLLPQSSWRLSLGYTRNRQDGPGLTTVQQFDARGDEFPLFADIRRERNEYRIGGELRLSAVRLNWLRGWDRFREDTRAFLDVPSPGNNPADRTALSSLRRHEPYHGTNPYWRLNLLAERRGFAANARFAYTAGRRAFVFDENAIGTDRLGAGRNRQILVSGAGRRPVAAGSLTLSVAPRARLSLTSHTAFHHTRLEGDASWREVNNATLGSTVVFFQFLGIRAITQSTDVTLRLAKSAALYGGHHFSARRIRSLEQFRTGPLLERWPAQQENRFHAGQAGVRFEPRKSLSVNLDAEVGRADRPFFPIAERRVHGLGARLRYRSRTLAWSAAVRTHYNTNSVSLAAHSSLSRNYAADVSWTPRAGFSLDAAYAKLHLDTVSALAYFAAGRLISQDRSLYVSNLHSATVGGRVEIGRVSLYAGYSHVQDTGDGRRTVAGQAGGSALPAFLAAQTYPAAFRSPLARLSVRLHTKLRWNAGYQYYGYREEFSPRQGYRAHTGYTSVLWSF
ncbi:MAG: hypothetical protein RMK57_03440 [Bryobacterales bacterium]|nr:hypothetical protein [Bryobacteraceae bacterium]MDW8353562.1 hypothetical protein [Bryobacterales bacterium]